MVAAVLALMASAAAMPGDRGQPYGDVLLDCRMRRASDVAGSPSSWSAPPDAQVSRFGWLLRGRTSYQRSIASFDYRGPFYVFTSGPMLVSRIDWPRRVELRGTLSLAHASREDVFRVLHVDRQRRAARVAVTQYEAPHGLNRAGRVVDGYFGDCVILQGGAAHRAFEGIE
jgi:hypothetical protein